MLNDRHPEGVSLDDMANVDQEISDSNVINKYGMIGFVDEDFSSPSANWEVEALKYAESIGVYEYKVNGRFIEYWTFYGQSEGWYFVRYDLREKRERFRGANIPWDSEVCLPAPGFLRTKGGATRYNYMVG
jgi:hypothetical protein